MIKTIFKNKAYCFKQDKKRSIIFANCITKKIDDQNFNQYHHTIEKIYSEHEKVNKKFSMILDMSELGLDAIKYGKKEAEFFNKLEPRTKVIINSICIISDSAVFRTAINFFVNIFGSVVPYKIVNNLDEALEFVEKSTNSSE